MPNRFFRFLAEHISLLRRQGFSVGLANTLSENAESFALRIWVVDNSESMIIKDGHIISEANGNLEMKSVTRWEELQDTVIYHAQMAAVLNTFTRFRLLNDPGRSVGKQEMVVGRPLGDVEKEIRVVRKTVSKVIPEGVTPLTKHLLDTREEIMKMLPELERLQKRVGFTNVMVLVMLPGDNTDLMMDIPLMHF
jgi:hypothetical protein